jgi:glucose-1-phosphate thymidylyltransferase
MNKINSEIIGIVPAAGKGTRLAPFPSPKELFPIGYQDYRIDGIVQKRPKVISQYLIENIIKAGASKLFIILGEDKHEIMRYYGDGHRFGVEIAYLYQENITGMPGAINLAHNWQNNSTVIFGMPDTIIEPHSFFSDLLKKHVEWKADLTLGLFPTENPSKFGMVDIDEDNNIRKIIDKPKQTSLKYMWGGACWSPVFSNILNSYLEEHRYKGKENLLGDVFTSAIENKLVVKGLLFSDGRYFDIGTADELDLALKKFHL